MQGPLDNRAVLVLLTEIPWVDPEWVASQLIPRGYSADLHRVRTQADFDRALALKPDLILAGVNRRGLNTARVVRALKTRGIEIPVLVLAQESEEDLALEALACGADDYILDGHLKRFSFAAARLIERRYASRASQDRQENDLRASYSLLFENVRDITASKQAEEALMESEERFPALIEKAPVGNATVNVSLYEQTRSRMEELQVLAKVSSSLRQARDLKEIIPLLVSQMVEVLGADAGDLILFPGDEFTRSSIDILPKPEPIWMALSGAKIIQRAFENQSVYYCEDRTREPELQDIFTAQGVPGIRSFAIVQLKTLDHTLGAMCVGFNQVHRIEEDKRRLLTAIGDIAANALHRTSLMGTLEQRVQVRTRDLEALYDIAALTSASIDLDNALGQCLDKVLEIFHIQSGLIQLLSDDGQELIIYAKRGIPDDLNRLVDHISLAGSIWARAIAQNSPTISADFGLLFQIPGDEQKTVPDVFLTTPLHVKGETLGVVSIFRPSLQEFSVEEIALLSTIANQIGVAVDSARLRRRSEEAAVLEERQRFARDLHDSVTQSLYSLNLMAEGYRRRVPHASAVQIDAWLSELGGLAHQALKDIRLLLYELRPSSIQYDGIAVAINRRLEAVEARSGVKFQLVVDGDLRFLTRTEEEELYHIAQEALNNSLKHAQASQVIISFSVEPDHLEMEVWDNGIGFDPVGTREEDPAHNGGLGLISMEQRAKRIGGTLEISSEPGSGTRVKVKK